MMILVKAPGGVEVGTRYYLDELRYRRQERVASDVHAGDPLWLTVFVAVLTAVVTAATIFSVVRVGRNSPASASSARRFPTRCFPAPVPWPRNSRPTVQQARQGSALTTQTSSRFGDVPPGLVHALMLSRIKFAQMAADSASGLLARCCPLAHVRLLLRVSDSPPGPRPRLRRPRIGTPRASCR